MLKLSFSFFLRKENPAFPQENDLPFRKHSFTLFIANMICLFWKMAKIMAIGCHGVTGYSISFTGSACYRKPLLFLRKYAAITAEYPQAAQKERTKYEKGKDFLASSIEDLREDRLQIGDVLNK